MAHKHTGNILICNVCDIEMCFGCASAIVETGEWVHSKCRKQVEEMDETEYRYN